MPRRCCTAMNWKCFRARRRWAACATTSRMRTRPIFSRRTSRSICCRRSMKRRSAGCGTIRKPGMQRCAGGRQKLSTIFSMAQLREGIAKDRAEWERRGASKNTLRNYGSDLEQFATYFEPPGEGAPEIEQLDLPLMREWLGGLYDQGLTVVSVRRKIAAVRAMFKFLLREGVVARNVAGRLRTPKAKQRLPEVMSAEKTNNLL